MEDFLSLAKKRCSVRSFTQESVSQEDLEKILEAGRVAPSGCNRQPQRLLVLREQASLDKLGKAANTFHAPVVIVVCAYRDEAWVRPYDSKNVAEIDVTIATDHMMLQAADLGLGSVWICSFRSHVLRSEFQLPDELEIVNLLAIGHPQELASPDRHQQLRKPLEQTVFFESYRS